jgi:transcription antitermination factor NusG
MRTPTPSNQWFALHVRPRFEKLVASSLLGKGYESFLPLYKTRSRWSDRMKEIDRPLFPGYLFCRLDLEHRLPLLVTPGVIQIVGIGKKPHEIDEAEIMAIQAIVASGFQAEPWPYLHIGKRVRIDRGPLADVEGILLATRSASRLVVSVTLLQRSVAVEIDSDWVTPLGSSAGRPGLSALKPVRH